MTAASESWFAVLVDFEWIEQRGFQLWEASTPVDVDGTVKKITPSFTKVFIHI